MKLRGDSGLEIPRTVPQGDTLLPGVRNVVAIASAKGGVGKSTISVNLALALARTGAKVGLLDADIYGPSLPLLMGVRRHPDMDVNGKMMPIIKQGVALMSIGFIAGEDAPVIWRGPLLAQTLQHFLTQVDWGELDYLLIDMPPGTGDIPLTLSQAIALSGALMVTTPQQMSLEDVERGIAMFSKVEVDILGMVENMSYYKCPHCDEKHALLGEYGGDYTARRLGVKCLASLPLDPTIGGPVPVMLDQPQSETAILFTQLATKLETEIQRLAQEF